MTILVTDEMGNKTKMPITIEVYTPIPNITEATAEKVLKGNINEAIIHEPIDIFRIRGSALPQKITETSILTDEKGNFAFQQQNAKETITVRVRHHSWQVKPTGIFVNFPSNFRQLFIPASENNPMHIAVFDENNAKVYSQFMTLPHFAMIVDSRDAKANTRGVITTLANGYHLQKMPVSHAYLPGGAYIVDANFEPILAIAKDGNIYSYDKNITFELGKNTDFITIIAKKSGIKIAELEYRLDFFFSES